jgi:GNAT superfamily N-acetyltransferase
VTAATAIRFRRAVRDDVPAIVALLADDGLGRTREHVADPLPEAYYRAFEEVDASPANELVVAEDAGGAVVGCMQLTVIPGLSRLGRRRAVVEAVRVAAALRGRGVGAAMMAHAAEWARARGCGLLQLTTDKSRRDAHRFYARLGFVASHEGMKLDLG